MINPLLAAEIYITSEYNNELKNELIKRVYSFSTSGDIVRELSKALALDVLDSPGHVKVMRALCSKSHSKSKAHAINEYWINRAVELMKNRQLLYMLNAFSKVVGKERMRDAIKFDTQNVSSWLINRKWKDIENYVETLDFYVEIKPLFLSDKKYLVEMYDDFSQDYTANCRRAVKKFTEIYLEQYGVDDIFLTVEKKYVADYSFISCLKSNYLKSILQKRRKTIIPSYNMRYWDVERNYIDSAYPVHNTKNIWLKCKCGNRWLVEKTEDRFLPCQECIKKVYAYSKNFDINLRGRYIIENACPCAEAIKYDESCFDKVVNMDEFVLLCKAVGKTYITYEYNPHYSLLFGYTKDGQLASILFEKGQMIKAFYYGTNGEIKAVGLKK